MISDVVESFVVLCGCYSLIVEEDIVGECACLVNFSEFIWIGDACAIGEYFHDAFPVCSVEVGRDAVFGSDCGEVVEGVVGVGDCFVVSRFRDAIAVCVISVNGVSCFCWSVRMTGIVVFIRTDSFFVEDFP